MKQLPKEIDELKDEFEAAVDVIRDLPAGDLRAKRIFALHKAKSYILFADKIARDGGLIAEAVAVARDAIQMVFDITEQKDSLIIPPRYDDIKPVSIPPLAKCKAEVQLSFPFMHEKK